MLSENFQKRYNNNSQSKCGGRGGFNFKNLSCYNHMTLPYVGKKSLEFE